MTLLQCTQTPQETLAPLSLPPRIARALIAKARARERDFLHRWAYAEEIKRAMRRDYARAVRQTTGEPRERFLSRSRAMWEEYEDINRVYLPDDPVYTGTRSGVTLATTTDLWTLTSGSTGQDRVLESYLGGENTASTVVRFAIQISTGGTTPTNQTPEKMNSRSPAAASTFRTAWTGQPTLSGNPLLFHAFNTFGGTDRWVAAPGAEIYLVNGEQLSGRSASGTPIVSSHLIWEEL